jgi:hypothetical protein
LKKESNVRHFLNKFMVLHVIAQQYDDFTTRFDTSALDKTGAMRLEPTEEHVRTVINALGKLGSRDY